eukprot:3570892-Prymnesium_polylepis.2
MAHGAGEESRSRRAASKVVIAPPTCIALTRCTSLHPWATARKLSSPSKCSCEVRETPIHALASRRAALEIQSGRLTSCIKVNAPEPESAPQVVGAVVPGGTSDESEPASRLADGGAGRLRHCKYHAASFGASSSWFCARRHVSWRVRDSRR